LRWLQITPKLKNKDSKVILFTFSDWFILFSASQRMQPKTASTTTLKKKQKPTIAASSSSTSPSPSVSMLDSKKRKQILEERKNLPIYTGTSTKLFTLQQKKTSSEN
jgi:hypothetical protein